MPRLISRVSAAGIGALGFAHALAIGALGAQSRLADSLLVRSLAFRSIGPAHMSGRIADLSVVEAPRAVRGGRLGTTIYVAVATGGVWKSTNGGTTWAPISDSIGVGSIGAVAAAPSNGEIVWVGSGEANNLRSSSWGVGVFKSADGGRTWSKAMLPRTQHIGRIVIDPRDPDVVYVAAVGPLWAPGGERGLFKTTDGGKSWTNTREISDQTGFGEVVMDPSNPDVLYAASLQRERREYGFLPGGTESAIWKTTDGAKSWTRLSKGLPTGEIGRIGLSVCRSRPKTVYASVHAKGAANGFYRSDDAGATWRQTNTSNGTAWFYSQVRCDPTDAEHVYRLNAASQESSDGGRTWTPFANGGGVHSDAHALWINPEAPEHIILGNDGGIDISHDRGRTWYNVENIVGAQFYAISVDDARPYYNVYGGLQDNSTWGGPSRTRNSYGPTSAEWFRMAGGDGFFNVTDPLDHNIVYAESQNGGIVRYDTRTGQSKGIKPLQPTGESHRYNWSAPIVPSRHAAGTVYLGANYLFKSSDRGESWKTISPDLTRHIDRNTLPMRGVRPAPDVLGLHEGTAEFSNISSVDESPRRSGLLVVGTDDGVVQVTRDDGASWTKTTTFPGVPDTTYVSRVILSRHAEGTVYATMDGHRSNDFTPYVLKSADFGKTWSAIAGDLPMGGSVQVIREHHRQPGLLFVGTEFGAFFTVNGGAQWTPLKSGLPGVPVWDLQIQERWNDLVLGTHGRGIYILDDLAAVEKLAEAKQAPVAFLFAPRDEIASPPNTSRNSGMGSTGFTGQNPDHGVRIAYLLNRLPDSATVTLEIVDDGGRVVRELPVSRTAGLYRLVWDMRVGAPLTGTATATATAAASAGDSRGGFGRSGAGASPTYTAVPGPYMSRLTVTPVRGTATVLTQRFTLLRDSQQVMTVAELRDLDAFRLTLVRLQRSVADAQAVAESTMRHLAQLRHLADSSRDKVTPAITAALSEADRQLARFTRVMGQSPAARAAPQAPRNANDAAGAAVAALVEEDEQVGTPGISFASRLGSLASVLSASFEVSQAQRMLFRSLQSDLQAESARLSRVRAEQLPALARQLEAAGMSVPTRPR